MRSQSRKRALSIGIICFVFAVVTCPSPARPGDQDRDANESVRDRFIGAWRLVQLEEAGEDGNVHKVDCAGMLVFTREGRMSVQVMHRNPMTAAPAGPVQYSQGGYEASFGRYEIDERARTFTYQVEGALVRSLMGKDLLRLFELSQRQLIVTPSNPNEHWRVVWEHY